VFCVRLELLTKGAMMMSTKNFLRRSVVVVIPAVVMASWSANADNTQVQKKDDKDALETIVVTATKRAVDVQEIPQAVSVVTSEQIDNLNAQTFEDYFRTVPGLTMNNIGTGDRGFDFSLRGISDFSAVQPSQTSATVGQYIDEIPVTAAGQQVDPRLVDIERIEVLRGPQGTFFGEDSLGGTIRIITKKPDLNGFSAAVEGRVSDTEHGGLNYSESVMANIPLSDTLAMRVNGYQAFDSGYINSVNTVCNAACVNSGVAASHINPDRADGGRATFLFKPADWFSLQAQYIHSDHTVDDSSIFEPKVGDLEINSHDLAYQQITDRSDLYNLTVNTNFGWANLVSSTSHGMRGVNDFQGDQPSPFPPQTATPTGTRFFYNTFAQELRLLSPDGWSDHWDYILGIYYNEEKQSVTSYGGPGQQFLYDYKEYAVFGEVGYKFTDELSARLGLREERSDYNLAFGGSGPGLPPANSGQSKPTTGRIVVDYQLNHDSLAYTSISRGFRRGGTNVSAYDSFIGALNPNIPITYAPDTTTNYELGLKFTFPERKATLAVAVYHIDWSNIQINGLASVPGGPAAAYSGYLSNAGGAKVDGIEVEGGVEILHGLQANVSFSLMNPRITTNEALGADSPSSYLPAYCQHGCPARAGDEIPFVSRISASASLNYSRPVGETGFSGFVNVSEQYAGPRNTDFAPTWRGPNQSPVLTCPSMNFGPCPVPLIMEPRTVNGDTNAEFRTMASSLLTNAQVGLSNTNWRISLYVNNLFDIRNQIFILPAGPSFPGGESGDGILVGRPRTVGLWVRRTF
jgi:iron complex outermembrane recepter protein